MSPERPNDAAALVVSGARSSVGTARRFVRDQLGPDVDDESAADITLVASELVTNAVEYGTGDPVEITVRRCADLVELTVAAAARELPIPAWEPAPVDAARGRGLFLVGELSDRLSIIAEDDVVTVTCRFVLAHPDRR